MSKAMVKNAADENQVKEGERRARWKREDEIKDLKTVMSDPSGRRTMWRLLAHCGVYESVFAPSTELTNYNSGRQDVGHYLMAELNDACPDEFDLMFKEARSATRKAKESNDV